MHHSKSRHSAAFASLSKPVSFTSPSEFSKMKDKFDNSYVFDKAESLQDDLSDDEGMLDGTSGNICRLLQDLVDLAGQTDSDSSTPVLAIELDGITTVTSLITDASVAYLSISASLPRCENNEYLLKHLKNGISNDDCELLWHADEGRYVLLRKIPISAFPDEPSVMDAILSTSDKAMSWCTAIRKNV